MNLYIRFFDEECVVKTVEDAINFLSELPDIEMNEALQQDMEQYFASSNPYPKRYKVRPRVYFIIIKTDANTLEEFKANKEKQDMGTEAVNGHQAPLNRLVERQSGWYEGGILFKRVVVVPGTGKFQYKDTSFRALVKAESGMDCYMRIIDHLKSRQDVDARSQFPSAKGKNFYFNYLGEEKPIVE
jgi:hypothetical protein